MEHIVFLTGRLAEKNLQRVLERMAPAPFTWEIREIGLQVAALMTADLIRRRVAAPVAADRIMVPGRCRGDLDALTAHYGIPVQRGPDEVKDLPEFFGGTAQSRDLSHYETLIFAEIVDAPRLDIEGICARAAAYRDQGADVIDIGCLPETPFPMLEDAVAELKRRGYRVSVDSMRTEELLRGGKAGADYLLSLSTDSLWVADEVASTPILIPTTPADTASLDAAVDQLRARGRPFLADPILDPIPFGLAASIARYVRLRERYPDIGIMMGVGNVTELTEADTSGINAVLLGMAAELHVGAILTTAVSRHARRAVKEADVARRIMYASREANELPKGWSADLATVHARKPFPYSFEEIQETAREIRDPNFRVQISDEGIHVYNRDGLHTGDDPFKLYPALAGALENDPGHAFYMGVELARAEIAFGLGKRYAQDQPLDWGAALDRPEENLESWCAPAPTKTKTKGSGG